MLAYRLTRSIISEILTKFSERVYEDHELLVENLLLWTRDSKNKLLFVERPDKTQLFLTPERFLLGPTDRGGGEYDDHSRNILLEEFFSSSNVGVPEVSDRTDMFTISLHLGNRTEQQRVRWHISHFCIDYHFLPGRGSAVLEIGQQKGLEEVSLYSTSLWSLLLAKGKGAHRTRPRLSGDLRR